MYESMMITVLTGADHQIWHISTTEITLSVSVFRFLQDQDIQI